MNNDKMIENIKILCKEHNMSITKLEEELGMSQGLISRWTKSAPSLSRIIDIADYFQVSLDEVVGRNQNINDEFLNALCEQTDNNILTWNSFESEQDTNAIKPRRNLYDMREAFDEDIYHEISYFARYDKGYITIYCFCKYNNSLSPDSLSLFIQPDDHSSLVWQDYSLEQLIPLWIKVLKQLSDEAPDDIKAEDLKNSFVSFTKKFSHMTKKCDLDIINDALKDPAIVKLIETMNTPEMVSLKETFSSPEFQTVMRVAEKIQKHFNIV